MFLIPGWLIIATTFPGVMLHELALKLMCWVLGIKSAISHFDFIFVGSPEMVTHDDVNELRQSLLVTYVPLLINSAACYYLSAISIRPSAAHSLVYLLVWLAISCGMHSFPRKYDVDQLIQFLSKLKPVSKTGYFVLYPLVAFLSISIPLKVVWFDAMYAGIIYEFATHPFT